MGDLTNGAGSCRHGFRPCPRAAIRNEKALSHPRWCRRRDCPLRLEIAFGDHLVAAVVLGGVEAFVGALEQGLRQVLSAIQQQQKTAEAPAIPAAQPSGPK